MDESPADNISRLRERVSAKKGVVVAELQVGDRAPAFELPGDGGGKIALPTADGRAFVLFFYPQDDTETCTNEAIGFSALKAEFDRLGITVVGISPDSARSHRRFKAKHSLTVDLAADEDRRVIDAYGVWAERTTFGRTYMGVVRTTFLVGHDGRIASVWRNMRVKTHPAEVLEAAKAL